MPSELDQVLSAEPAEALRVDARHNRDLIVAAAAEAFAQRGLDISMAAIARRAGVGVATLFRRFPTKEALVTEVFSSQFRVCGELLDRALEDPDPWRAFCVLLESMRRMQVNDRGFTEALLAASSSDAMTHQRIVLTEHGFARLVQRAQEAGRLRTDFSTNDVFLVLLSIGGVTTGPKDVVDAASRRLLAYLIESFAAQPGTERRPLPAAPEMDFRAAVDAIGRPAPAR